MAKNGTCVHFSSLPCVQFGMLVTKGPVENNPVTRQMSRSYFLLATQALKNRMPFIDRVRGKVYADTRDGRPPRDSCIFH